MSTVRLQLVCVIYSSGLLKKSTFEEFRFGLIFCIGSGLWECGVWIFAVLQEGGRHARSASIRAEGQGEH
jgi:hypothetical protein